MEINVDYNKNLLYNFCVSRTLYLKVDINIAMAVKNFIKSLHQHRPCNFALKMLWEELFNLARMSLLSPTKMTVSLFQPVCRNTDGRTLQSRANVS